MALPFNYFVKFVFSWSLLCQKMKSNARHCKIHGLTFKFPCSDLIESVGHFSLNLLLVNIVV